MPHRTCSARERKRHGAFGAPAGRDALCKSHERSRSVVSLSGGHTTICSRGKRERTSSRTQHAREPIPYALQRWVTLNGPGAAPRATPTLALHRRRLRKAGSDGQARQEALLHRLREFLQRTLRPSDGGVSEHTRAPRREWARVSTRNGARARRRRETEPRREQRWRRCVEAVRRRRELSKTCGG
jgi:hypothetical protein